VRPFFAGEVVAVQAEGGGYRYAAVDAARLADAPAEESRRLVVLRAPELTHVSPLAVFSFATQRRPPPADADADADADAAAAADAADAAADGPSEPLPPPPQAPPPPPAALGSAQLIEAVASVMSRAGKPLDA
jgi:hypothetical protein